MMAHGLDGRAHTWNQGKLIGANLPRSSHVWSIRAKLHIAGRIRDLALFNLAIDSKLRGRDVVAVRVVDVARTVTRSTERRSARKRPDAQSDSN
jgi:hypothetical protein